MEAFATIRTGVWWERREESSSVSNAGGAINIRDPEGVISVPIRTDDIVEQDGANLTLFRGSDSLLHAPAKLLFETPELAAEFASGLPAESSVAAAKRHGAFLASRSPNPVSAMALCALLLLEFGYVIAKGTPDPLGLALHRDTLPFPNPTALLTSAFHHWSLIHLALNIAFMMILGPLVERMLGSPKRFLALFFGSAAFGAWVSLGLGTGMAPTAGASGGVFGMFGVLLAHYALSPNVGASQARQGTLLALWIIGGNLAVSLLPIFDFPLHLAGLLFGFTAAIPFVAVKR